MGASDSGKAASFAIDSTNDSNLLSSLGLGSTGNYVAGADAAITLNGVEYTSKSNIFTIQCQGFRDRNVTKAITQDLPTLYPGG